VVMHNPSWSRVRRGAMDRGMIDIHGRGVDGPGITAPTMPDARGDRGVEGSIFTRVVAKDADVAIGCADRRLPGGGIVHHLPGWISVGLGISPDIGIGIRALLIALHGIGCQEASNHRIIVPCSVTKAITISIAQNAPLCL
jgi:hypothetical protein